MYTIRQFAAAWQRLHHPTMSVDGDVTRFYRLYRELYHLVAREARGFDSHRLLSFLLYVENTIAVGLDGVYEYRYRVVGNVENRWCNGLGLSAHAYSRVHALVGQAVADARGSALRQWMEESVLSGDFPRLAAMLTYFVREDRVLRLVFPTPRFREAMFSRLTGCQALAREMLWTDLAFNWRDKRGHSLAETIAGQFRQSSAALGEEESVRLKEVADRLDTLHPERLDTYTVIAREDERSVTLRHADGREFRHVTFPSPVPANVPNRHLAAQLVTYRDHTYINSPVAWLTEEAMKDWDGATLWNDIQKQEQDAARQVSFTTPFGQLHNLYDDLYTIPEDPEEARLSDMGIYPDEPNILDFLEWMRPKGTVNGTAG